MRRLPVRVAAGAGALAALGLTAATAALGSAVVPAERATVPVIEVAVAAGETSLTCAGPPQLPGGEDVGGTDPAFEAAPSETSTVSAAVALGEKSTGDAAPAATVPALTLGDSAGVAAADVTVAPLAVASGDGAAPTSARAVPTDAGPPSLAAVQVALTPEGDLRGLAASACVEPSDDAWLVGGGTVVGRSARLVLANPGATTASADLTVLTPAGTVEPPTGQGLVLAPGEQMSLLVEGLAPEAAAVAVRVEVSGGRVGATLVDTLLRGLVPGGVETVVPGAVPAPHQVVPGLVVADGGPPPVLRFAVPGGEDGVVRWRLLGGAGPVALTGPAAATVPAGTVMDVPVEGLPAGDYTAVVDADVPVLAAASSGTGLGGDDPSDTAWSPAGAELAGTSLVALPPGPSADGVDGVTSRLVLSADDDAADVEVQALAADGARTGLVRVAVPTGATVTSDVAALAPDGAAALLVTPPAGVRGLHAAVVLAAPADEGADLVSVLSVRPAPTAPSAVGVRTVQDGRWP